MPMPKSGPVRMSDMCPDPSPSSVPFRHPPSASSSSSSLPAPSSEVTLWQPDLLKPRLLALEFQDLAWIIRILQWLVALPYVRDVQTLQMAHWALSARETQILTLRVNPWADAGDVWMHSPDSPSSPSSVPMSVPCLSLIHI